MNVLYISNISGKRMKYSFSGSAIEASHLLGFDFYSVANRSRSTVEDIREDESKYGVKLLHIDLERTPYSLKNLKAYKQLCKIIRDNEIDVIHCNTPVGGLLGRLAGKSCGVKKVIYQVHGFHFYKGAPKKSWLLYYPVEKWLAGYTDALVTINREDYEFATEKMKLRNNGKVYYVPGVGIDTEDFRFDPAKRAEKRQELGLSSEDVMLLTSGNLDKNKNFSTLIKAVAESNNQNIKLYICGQGTEMEALSALVCELDAGDRIHLLGYRNDMKDLLSAADVFVMTSFREGLSRSIMEAMAIGLPCVVSKIRGNVDLIEDGVGGFLCPPTDARAFAEAIEALASDPAKRESMKQANLEKIEQFSLPGAIDCMKKIYEDVIN